MIKTTVIFGRPAAAEAAAPGSDFGKTREEQRFAALYDAHATGIYRFCLRLTGGRTADAEDLTQEVLLAAFQGLPRFAGRSGTRTWLFRIAVFRWRSLKDAQARTNGGQTASSLDPDNDTLLPPGFPSHPDMAAVAITRLSLEAALSALPDTLRESFFLVKAEGLTHREAARVLEIPQGTVQSRVHDAVKRLRVLLADDFPTHAAAPTPSTRRPDRTGDAPTRMETNHEPANH